MKYRSKHDIIATILNSTLNGETKATIRFKAHLNDDQIKRYISSMLSKQLIKERHDNQNLSPHYQITEKGSRYLQIYQEGQFFHLLPELVINEIDRNGLFNNHQMKM